MSRQFAFKPGFPNRGQDPNRVGEAIAKVRNSVPDEADTRDLHEALLKKAKAKASPLHPFAEWDNDKAAHSYRIGQMSRLVRSVEVVHVDREKQEVARVRAFPVIERKGEKTGTYHPINVVMADEMKLENYRHQIRRALISAMRQCKEFEELAPTLAHLEAAAAALDSVEAPAS